MLQTSKILITGLNNLANLEKGRYKAKKGATNIFSAKKSINILTENKRRNHDDDIDSEYDEILLPIQDDIFDKKEIIVNKLYYNISLINSFPNALLLQESVFNKPKSEKILQPDKTDKTDKIIQGKNQPDDIWDILTQLKKDNDSECLDTLTTESETIISDNDDFSEKICKGCNCKGTLIEDQHTSVIVCSECGMVNEELLDHGPEWRQYNNDDNRGEGVNRCGCPSNFFFPKSSQGTIMAGSCSSKLKRKQKWNSMVYKERSLNLVFEYISQICAKNNIPKIIVDSAKILYKRLSDCKHKAGPNIGKQIIIRGENRLSIIAACVFKACEMNKNPRNVKEIAEFFELDEKKVTKGIKHFDRIMKNADDNNIVFEQFKTNSAEDYIRRHCPKLKINKQDTNMAVKIAHNCCKMKLASDHNPQSVAAGSILVMVEYCDLDIDKKDIATLFKTSDVTIGKIYSKIAPYAQALVNDAATEYLIKKFKING